MIFPVRGSWPAIAISGRGFGQRPVYLSCTIFVVAAILLLESVIFKIIFETGSRFKNSGQTLIENLQPDPD